MTRWPAAGRALALSAAVLVPGAQAAVLRGMVVDNLTGRPLARALVTLRSVEGYASVDLAARADRAGVFAFPALGAGAYLLAASRPGFAPLRYGQKAWNAPGTPILVEQDGSIFLQLRLRRMAAITGTVWDENEIGFPDQEVVVYRAAQPPKLVSRTKTDDRGMYRFGLLEPGRYLIRTMAKQIDEETGLLPTFHRESATVEDAAAVAVTLEEQTTEINVRPLAGKLCRLSGTASPAPQSLTLISDMGEMAGGADSFGRFHFENLAPGEYELIASASVGRFLYGFWQKITIERDAEMRIGLQQAPLVQLGIEDQDGKRVDAGAIAVMGRRVTLAGTGGAMRLRDRAELAPGRWEIEVNAAPDFFPVSITADGRSLAPAGRADGWHELAAAPGRLLQIRVTLSSRPARVRGKVTGAGHEPVMGAPVWLEPIDTESRRRLREPASTLTDAHGEYRFAGLAPGLYRLLSTLEFDHPEEAEMQAARAKEVALREGESAVQDLDLYLK